MLDIKLFLVAIEELERQGMARDVVIKALTESFEIIIKKKHVEGLPDLMVNVNIDPEKGIIDIFNIKNIVEEVEDDAIEISLEDAREIDPNAEVGGQLSFKIEIDEFSKQDANKFKSVLKQKIKEAEKAAILSLYADKIDEIITGYVEKVEGNFTLVNIGRTSVVLKDKEKIGNEEFTIGQSIKVYLMNVSSSNDAGITISRACPGFLKRLFEEEIHDVFDGTVIIKDIARQAGERAKVSVASNDFNVDPVGACIGPSGTKIQKICNQINREKIDIIQYHDHKGLFVAESLKPAEVVGVKFNEDGSAVAIIKDGSLKIAIGKSGVNVRLAAKLTGCKIEVKEETDAINEGIEFLTIDQMKKEEEQIKFEARRKELMEQIAREAEERKIREAEEERLKEERRLAGIEDEVEDEFDEEFDEEYDEYEEEYEETPVEDVVEEVVEEVEEKVEFKPVILQPQVSLAELERKIEEDKKKKAGTTNNKKKKVVEVEEEVETPVVKETERMEIYTQEELDEMEEEYEDEYYDDDEDINYDDYDKYYDED